MKIYGDTFKALSDLTRLRIMNMLLTAGHELCICEIMDALALAQYAISRHIKELKIAGLVQERKAGRFVFYALTRPNDKYHHYVMKALAAMDAAPLAHDAARLKKRLALRGGTQCVAGIKKCGR
jgi:ArsR family transcriptional regulator